jgi:SAM-dependent methyltransferase
MNRITVVGRGAEFIIARRMDERPEYLEPYRRAAARHGGEFGALLWASPRTQAVRFEAMAGLVAFGGRRVLDVGCGRADLADFLVSRGVFVRSYVGVEGVEELVEAARAKGLPEAEIVRGDFVADPSVMEVGADVVAISGALNTMEDGAFYATLRRAHAAAREGVVFNFLSSTMLAGAEYLRWRRREAVIEFASALGGQVRVAEGYLPGDCTVAVGRGL